MPRFSLKLLDAVTLLPINSSPEASTLNQDQRLNQPMKTTRLLFASLIAALVCSCSSGKIDMPSGNSKGYTSARLIKTSASTPEQGLEDSESVNRMVQQALAAEFSKRGLAVGEANADLLVAYMIIRQTTSTTTMNNDHFGYGRDAEKILARAHEQGVVKSTSPEEFEQGAILIDLLDARSNELVFRNYAKRSITEGISDEVRQQRINGIIAEAIAPFFK